jgi:outer membrane lipoprotein-sorting protein
MHQTSSPESNLNTTSGAKLEGPHMQPTVSFWRGLSLGIVCGATVALLAPVRGATADEPKPEGASAKEIIDRMAEVYAGCKSYRDSGLVKTLFVQKGGNRTVEKPFKTAFVRPGQFRFEYDEKGNPKSRFIIWSKGKEIRTWWDVTPGVESPESLDLALAAATGVSSSSAHTIPQLLLPHKVSGRSIKDIEGAKRGEDGKLEKVDCFRIDGKFGDHPVTLWIEKTSFLVRRIDEQVNFDNFRTEQTTTYDPTIDKEIADNLLEFDPPVGK